MSWGSGRRSIEFALPRTMTSPARQSISSNRSFATSPDRIPRRTNMVRMAMSRQPRRVAPSHDAKRRRTWSGANPFSSPANRRPATDGATPTNEFPITPSRCRNLRNDRRAVTVSFTAPRLWRGQRVITNEMTSAAVRRPRSQAGQGGAGCMRQPVQRFRQFGDRRPFGCSKHLDRLRQLRPDPRRARARERLRARRIERSGSSPTLLSERWRSTDLNSQSLPFAGRTRVVRPAFATAPRRSGSTRTSRAA